MSTTDHIRERLAVLDPLQLDIHDDSAAHAGHAGARQGGGHYDLVIVSARFEGCSAVARHRLIYTALGDMMRADIHALAIKAYTPAEFEQF
jgi:BolA protein